MSSLKISRLTNVRTRLVDGEDGEWLSKVEIEFTRPCSYAVKKAGHRVFVKCNGAVVNMPEGIIEVNDGLLREIGIWHLGGEIAEVEIVPEHPARFYLEAFEGIPFRLEVTFNRSFITDLFNGKKFVVDPG